MNPAPAPEAPPDEAAEAGPARADRADPRADGLEATLLDLAQRALAEGDVEAAEARYRRLLRQDPGSEPARLGLVEVALARGQREVARERLERVVADDPASVEGHLGLARLETDPALARAHLERALERRPDHPGVFARLAEVTGRAPHRAGSLEEAIALAAAHPFDPTALLDAGRLLADAGRSDEAKVSLEGVLALADLDPAAAEEALAALRALDPAWAGRRAVPVRVYVDAALRVDAGWRFRQRRLWLELSHGLDPLLATRFLVVGFAPFDGAPPGTPLDARLRGLVYQTGAEPDAALFAGFTAEPTPRRAGARHGIAAYLGRHLFVRDAPDEPVDRILAHELLHIYGGVHVADDLDSLMNPSGDSRQLDPLNADIARAIARRGFGPGGLEENVLSRIDLEETTRVYLRALQANLAFRQAGLDELLGEATQVGPGAWSQMQQVIRLDSHMGDVSGFVARLLWSSQRRAQAVGMLELAAQLYGRRTPQGRAAWTQAEVLRNRLRFELGVP